MCMPVYVCVCVVCVWVGGCVFRSLCCLPSRRAAPPTMMPLLSTRTHSLQGSTQVCIHPLHTIITHAHTPTPSQIRTWAMVLPCTLALLAPETTPHSTLLPHPSHTRTVPWRPTRWSLMTATSSWQRDREALCLGRCDLTHTHTHTLSSSHSGPAHLGRGDHPQPHPDPTCV